MGALCACGGNFLASHGVCSFTQRHSILGPTAGGFLSYPADKFPSLVPAGSLLDVHPFLLPCLVSASVNVMGLVVGWILLKETLPNPSRPWWWRRIARACLRTCSQRGRPSSSARAPRAPSQGTSVRHVELVAVDSDDSGDEANGAGRGARSDKPSARVQRRGPTTTGYTVVGRQRLDSSDEEGEGNALNGGVRADKPAHSLPRDTAELPPELLTPAVAPKSTYTVFCEVVRTPSVLLILGMNSTLAFIVVCLQELFPLWASSSISDGGLAFRPDDIGVLPSVACSLVCTSASLLCFNMLQAPSLDSLVWFSSRTRFSCCRWLNGAWVPERWCSGLPCCTCQSAC